MPSGNCSNCPQSSKLIEDLQKENEELKTENQKLNQDNQTVIKELKSLAEQVIILSEQTKILDQNTNKEKLSSHLKDVKNLEELKKQLETQCKELKSKINLKTDEMRSLENENNRLRDEINRRRIQLDKEHWCVPNEIESLSRQILTYTDKRVARENLGEYYDSRIDADSFYTLLREKAWPIEYNNNERYKQLKKLPTTKVAVLGYENTGKSFLLSKLAGCELPQGTLTKTVGLCLKYPTDESRPWTALDTPGTNISVKTEEMKDKLSAYFEQKGLTGEDGMRMLLGDNILMENLLQEFVVKHAQVLLVVIGKVHRDDQRLINRIKSLPGKRIIIVHNLMDARNKEDVEDMIREDILKTFPVTERQFYLEKIEAGNGEGMNRLVYLENDERNDRAIEHIVMAHEGSPAGNYYNESAFYYIKTLITSMPFVQPFDLAQAFLDHLNEKFKNYLQPKNQETVNPFAFENDENGVPKAVMLNNPLQYDLKLSSADEFGQIRTFAREGLEDIAYTVKIVPQDPNTKSEVKAILKVEIEIAGKYDKTNIKYKLLPMQNNQARIEIRGKSEDNTIRANEKILENHRKFGEFTIYTEPVDLEKFVINPREKCDRNNTEAPGLMILSWNLYEPAEDSD